MPQMQYCSNKDHPAILFPAKVIEEFVKLREAAKKIKKKSNKNVVTKLEGAGG